MNHLHTETFPIFTKFHQSLYSMTHLSIHVGNIRKIQEERYGMTHLQLARTTTMST